MQMNRHDFDLLLQKYLAGGCSAEEEKLIEQWSAGMLSERKRDVLSKSERQALRKRLWKRLEHSALHRDFWGRTRKWLSWSIAAAVALFVVGYAIFPVIPGGTVAEHALSGSASDGRQPAVSESIYLCEDGGSCELVLEDSSRISLKKGSRLRYPEKFGPRSRLVYLEGEAFFRVRRDPDRPFLVYSGNLVTQVLGTSFQVKSYQEESTIEVKVVSGRVSVYEDGPDNAQSRQGVILTPNQKITFEKASGRLLPEIVEAPVIVNPPEKRSEFIFEEEALPRVLTAIQEAYGVEIVVETPALETCVFTGDLNDLPLHTQLRLICRSVSGSYEVRGTTFFFRGEGCPKPEKHP